MSTSQDFALGALVRLKSGGPVMTVERVHDSGVVVCVWQDERGVQTYAYQPWVVEAVQLPRTFQTSVQDQIVQEMAAYRRREGQDMQKSS